MVNTAGISMTYEERGSGMPLLLIHGYPLSRRLWDPQLEGLSDIARLIAPDLAGFGESRVPAGSSIAYIPYTMDQYADDCAALLDTIGITTPLIVGGLSMGGYIAFAFQRRYSQRVAGLILASTRAAPDSEAAKANRDKAAALVEERGVAAIAESMLPMLMSPASYQSRPQLVEVVRGILLSASPEGIVGALLGMRDRPDSTPNLANIDVPVLILHGTDDLLISVEEAESMQVALPKARLQLLPEAGHLLNLEQPDLFNQAVRHFIQERID